MKIQHNLPAMNASRLGNVANLKGKKASERLSSGYRINSAADDSAGLAISEKMRAQLRGLKQAVRNSQDAINLVQTFEGALNGSDAILQRCKELAVQSANGSYGNEIDRAAIQLEYDQLSSEIDHIADTDFNGVYMLNGNPSVEYVDTVKSIPTEGTDYSPVFDENGNPTLDTESYRLDAQFESVSPFKDNGMFAPAYTLRGQTVQTEYDSGSTDHFKITVRGTYVNPDTNQTETISRGASDVQLSDIETTSETDPNNNVVHICRGKCEISVDPSVTCELIQKATQRPEYLQQNGADVLDENNQPIVVSLRWDLSYEIKMGDDTDSNFTLDNLDFTTFSDTVLGGSTADSNERYYCSDPLVEGAIARELLYDRNNGGMIDSFSSYYFDPTNATFADVSNKMDIDTSANGPDILKLGRFSNGDNLHTHDSIQGGTDLAYTMAWNGRSPNADGVIQFSLGSRGLSSSAGDANIYPRPVIEHIEYVETNAVMLYNDVELSVQTGARTKDLVTFTFEYEIYNGSGLKADLNCTSMGLGLDKLSLSDRGLANIAIDKLDNAINKVSLVRASLGATQNRLEKKIDNLTNIHENITSSESHIRDTDVPQEMMNFTKSQIIAQASQAMLAQTNELPRSVLNLIS